MTDPPTLRLANLTHLTHPMSVDLHLDDCATKSRLVIARVLGGAGYWRYGVEQYAARLHAAGVPFAALPGDDKPDPELRGLSTVADEDYDALWAYLVEGGPRERTNLLAYASAMLDGGEKPNPPRPLLRAGVYWPGAGMADLARRAGRLDRRRPGRARHFLPRAGAGRRAEPDQPADPGACRARAEPAAGLRGLAERPASARHA